LECKTYRYTSHAGAGLGQHNHPEELKQWILRDPIALFEQKLREEGAMTAAEQETLMKQVLIEVDEAVAFAKRSPFPTFEEMPAMPHSDLLA
jgi:pyruvate dehydrogenase E1 component alpha subunit